MSRHSGLGPTPQPKTLRPLGPKTPKPPKLNPKLAALLAHEVAPHANHCCSGLRLELVLRALFQCLLGGSRYFFLGGLGFRDLAALALLS